MHATPSPARVAVVGGTGWIGRHLLAAFAARGHDVLALARNNAPHVPASAFRRLDLTSAGPARIAALLHRERVGVVVNATDGANANDGWDRTDEEMARTNVHAVEDLLAALARLPRPPRLIQLGSMHEYGPVPDGTLMDESLVPAPVNTYTRSRLAGTDRVLTAARSGTADALVLRLANVCGPHPSPAAFLGKLLQRLRTATEEGSPTVLTVARSARRDFVDVRDVSRAVVLAAASSVSGRVVNIGSGTATALPDLVGLLVSIAGPPAGLVAQRLAPVPGLGGDWMRVDNRLAADLLGWKPEIALRTSLEDMWRAR
ncbi:NAD-dependent epimerase/dehydratase family protein [Streptomyces candidus]|uniref:Nucleoside-diphosphate-sugar epimerase n=1 Tax=Streptomyces candidus TaxID=67283 RepID=A0A7X0HFQ2_9ACTN|nr:NAD(P)-dependent oxidoreductase [Streptomyces candidus]MBB6436691.1 nucleoside-diphosphate-sugar epimerase [Streptomyces candidus]GHH51084.1 reductase [Streptomyces candidus]